MAHAAFLRAIRAAPADDTARVVFADYLDEQNAPGDTALAEFIRTQVRLATLDETHPDRPALEDRENELLRAHEREWVGKLTAPVARGLLRWRFERGFLAVVQIAAKTLASSKTPLFNAHPIDKVRLLGLESAPDATLKSLASRPWWNRVSDLDMGPAVALTKLETLLRSPHLTQLRKLGITAPADIAPRVPELLAGCAALPHLEELTLGDWRHDPDTLLPALESSGVRTLGLAGGAYTAPGLRALLASDFAARGGRVRLAGGNLGPSLWPAFMGKQARPAVTRMSFAGTGRNPTLELPTLLSAPGAANLTALELSETGQSGASVRAVAKSGFLARATELGLTRCHVGPKVLAALAKVAAPNLRALALGEVGLGNAGVRVLCDAEWADGLTGLDLMRNGIDDEALRAMAGSGRFVNLRRLDLRVNSPDLGGGCRVQIGDAGAAALAAAPNFARLRHLNLYRTRVTARGVDALLNSSYCRLAELELGGYDLGPDLPAVLARAPGLVRLTRLSLSFTPALGGDALLPVAESPHLSPLCRLDVRYINPSRRVTGALVARLGRRLETNPPVGTW